MKVLKRLIVTTISVVVIVWLLTFLSLRFESHAYTQLSDEQQSAALAYLDGKLTPAPEVWQWDVFSPEPGVELRTGLIDAEDAKGTVIVVPGFTATIEMTMREIVRINAGGYRVASLEHRGQGESYRPLANPEKGYVESYAKLGADLAAFAKKVRIPGKPLFFYSISQGAHITLRMAGEQNLEVSAFTLVVPLIKLNSGDDDYEAMRTVTGVLNTLGLGNMYFFGHSRWPSTELIFGRPNDCNANPETAQTREALFAQRETLRTNNVTVKWLHETGLSTETLLRPDHIAAIDQPVQMITAGVDLLVDTPEAQQFCQALHHCELVHLAESRHCITREDFELYDRIVDDAIAHFDKYL